MAGQGEFVLRSSRPAASIELEWQADDQARATLVSTGLRAELVVYLPEPPHVMADLLAETAQQWQGWTGSKEWRSLEGELAFVWSHDGLGRVTFLVTLDARLVWRTEATIPVEAGQLGRIAAEFRSFCSPA